MTAATFDLQSHSIYSDGELPPAEVVAAAAQAGVELLSLTDHDSTDGVLQAQQAAEQVGIALLTGVEVSVRDPSAPDIHVCGYRIDPDNPSLGDQLARSRADRTDRAERMITALGELGFAVDRALLDSRTAEGKAIGRPHLAAAVVQHPDNAARLTGAGLTDSTAFLVAYLIPGRPAFVERLAPTVEEAISLIHGAGGFAVWAHPFWDITADRGVLDTLDRFVAAGLDGVEAFYVTYTEEQTRLLAKRCAELGLLTTGSSDFHGPSHVHFNRFRAFETYGLEPSLGPLQPA